MARGKHPRRRLPQERKEEHGGAWLVGRISPLHPSRLGLGLTSPDEPSPLSLHCWVSQLGAWLPGSGCLPLCLALFVLSYYCTLCCLSSPLEFQLQGGDCFLQFCVLVASLPGSSVHGTLQARILEWVAISYSRGSSRPRNRTDVSCISCIGRHMLYHCATWEAPYVLLLNM